MFILKNVSMLNSIFNQKIEKVRFVHYSKYVRNPYLKINLLIAEQTLSFSTFTDLSNMC